MLARSGKFYGPIRPDWRLKIQEICFKIGNETNVSQMEFQTLMKTLALAMNQRLEDVQWGNLLLIYLGKLEELLKEDPRKDIPLNLIHIFQHEIRIENRR
jgi:hypothetical protein